MPIRLKKMIGALLIVVFLLIWISIAVAIGISGLIPRNPLAELAYYAIAGMGWGLPLLPLLKWLEKGK